MTFVRGFERVAADDHRDDVVQGVYLRHEQVGRGQEYRHAVFVVEQPDEPDQTAVFGRQPGQPVGGPPVVAAGGAAAPAGGAEFAGQLAGPAVDGREPPGERAARRRVQTLHGRAAVHATAQRHHGLLEDQGGRQVRELVESVVHHAQERRAPDVPEPELRQVSARLHGPVAAAFQFVREPRAVSGVHQPAAQRLKSFFVSDVKRTALREPAPPAPTFSREKFCDEQ